MRIRNRVMVRVRVMNRVRVSFIKVIKLPISQFIADELKWVIDGVVDEYR